ncbi:hypothetical protein NFX46_31815 [Streptomyces phaeoluteigriseus]|uniref:Uncharacterized protein n=1 Tax=Streptomyces phaeoluteigriseus TaxID=114686 RepID=A0ABY4ZHS3_9ACTN|nr:hypothetical protein [Streptomyces phaeoluteigriseus]USQ87918.1 hypothetical protein NFX46_31815 [Streptomyces phaeoluteigriseus]
MTFGDQGFPYGPPDPYARFAAEQNRIEQDRIMQDRIRRRRRNRRVAVAGVGAVLVAAVAAGVVTAAGGDDRGGPAAAPPAATATPSTSGPAVPSVDAGLPSDAPSALPSLLARPVIRPEQAFPSKSVRVGDGSRYSRVDLATTTDCGRGMSAELAELIEQGEECARLTAALFTDADRRSQITVTVLSFARVEDASRVFMMASMDPVTYQVVSLDPPPEAGMPTVPPGSAGVFRRVMTVRSVVFANGQWGDGSETGEAELTAQTEGLLRHVNETVVAYEDGEAEGSG